MIIWVSLVLVLEQCWNQLGSPLEIGKKSMPGTSVLPAVHEQFLGKSARHEHFWNLLQIYKITHISRLESHEIPTLLPYMFRIFPTQRAFGDGPGWGGDMLHIPCGSKCILGKLLFPKTKIAESPWFHPRFFFWWRSKYSNIVHPSSWFFHCQLRFQGHPIRN